jgi:outer membrane lipoprotein-sorting protein
MNLQLPKAKLLFLCCLLQIGLPFTAAGATGPEELASLLEEVEAAAAEVRSLSCGFTQEKRLALFARPIIFHGTLDLVRPDRLRWEFTSPVPSVLIFKGESGLRCNDRAEPVRFDLKKDPVMQIVARQLWLWLGADYTRLAEEYHLRLAGPDTLVLAPRDLKIAEFVSSITISFAPDSRQPQLVEIAEPGGDLTRISFHGYRFDAAHEEALFEQCGGRE